VNNLQYPQQAGQSLLNWVAYAKRHALLLRRCEELQGYANTKTPAHIPKGLIEEGAHKPLRQSLLFQKGLSTMQAPEHNFTRFDMSRLNRIIDIFPCEGIHGPVSGHYLHLQREAALLSQ
jgi:hypothetical protein